MFPSRRAAADLQSTRCARHPGREIPSRRSNPSVRPQGSLVEQGKAMGGQMGSQQGWLCPASPGLCAARQPMTACASATDAGRRTASQPTNQPTSRTKSKSSFTFRQPCMHHPHCMRAARSERHGWCWLLHCYAQRAETAAAQFVSGQRPSRPPPGTDRWRHSPRPNITSRHSPASRRAVVASAFSYRLGLRRATIRGGPSRSLGRRAA